MSMQKTIFFLTALLSAQAVLALVLNLSGDNYDAYQPNEKLLALAPEKVDKVTIEDGDNRVQLQRKDGRWGLPQLDGFVADQTAVQRLLDSISGLRKGWPVATTASATKRFQVSDEGFERKLTLATEQGKVETLYVGTSPGFRKVHLRPEGDDAVYTADFNTWEANAKPDDWIDRDALHLPSTDITDVQWQGIHLQRDGDTMKLADLKDQERSDREKVETLLTDLAGLRIASVLVGEQAARWQQATPSLEIKLGRKDAEPLDYQFRALKDGDGYLLRRSDQDWTYRVEGFALKPLLDARRESLVLASKPQGTETAAGAAQDADKPQG